MKTEVVAIAGVHNEEKTVQNVCRQLMRSGLQTVVLIVNGCSDSSLQKIYQLQNEPTYRNRIMVEHFSNPLGHDVSRAMGTYCASRATKATWFLYVDTDWAGSFGPNMEEFVQFAIASQADVVSLSQSALSTAWRHDEEASRAWRRTLLQQNTIPRDAVPYMLPMMIRRTAFQKISPFWLAHPGLWMTAAAKASLSWVTFPRWSMHVIGHRTRSAIHHNSVELQIEQDAKDALLLLKGSHKGTSFASILSGKDPVSSRYLPTRDYRTLVNYASELSIVR